MRTRLVGLIVSAAALFIQQACLAFDDGDFQFWNTEELSWSLVGEWGMQLEQEFRWGDDARNPYYRHTDLGFNYSGLSPWLDIGFNYRQIFEEKSTEWKSENRPHFNATVKFNLGDFKLSNRSRFEYRNREDADNFWQYRNKLSLKLPVKFTRFELKPYLADEIFVNFDEQELDRNRLCTGWAFKLFKDLGGELYYLWQRSKKSGNWSDANVLGTKLKLAF
ncbi:MAG: DUF2490 domain-containing protein [Candidatus Omnitrophica bacterium]|nr:DUF2490 domain-containing protein [Candidatus Omnitrophota bacterium]